jgi:DNA primase large subunit
MFSGEERKKFGESSDQKAQWNDGGLKYPLKLNLYVCSVILGLHSLSTSYDKPPLYDVTIEDFETCALDRLRVLAEIESSAARNRSWEDTKTVTRNQYMKYLRLDSLSHDLEEQELLRRYDHLGHFVLRLAFCRS